MRDLSQDEAAERLAPHLGQRWSKTTLSAAERSIDGVRIRNFTADEILAFAKAFDVPVTYFYLAPPWTEEVGQPEAEPVPAQELVGRLFDVGPDARDWLLREAVPMTAETTLALRQARANLDAVADARDAEVAALFTVHG